MQTNPYLVAVRAALPRILALFDTDRTSASHGVGDRRHWAWGVIDFANATFQGAAHGLARLWTSGLWPYETPAERFLERIDALFAGTRRLTRSDGSLEEAFPHEGSFCVTALVAYDLLCALELLGSAVPAQMRARWQATIARLIGHLLTADEGHAFISNHLATAAAALARWHSLTGDLASETKARQLFERIVEHQSSEGWYEEYGGADPGYQSLATCYLADLHRLRPQWGMGESLQRSLEFLWHFAHPDGSFGGLYGSRCTRFYFPAGIELLASALPQAAALAQTLADSVSESRVVGLDSIDEPNLVPMFNAYCWAAELRAAEPNRGEPPVVVPALRGQALRKHFERAGLWVDAGPSHYTVIGAHKGGVVMHFRDGRLARCDAGVVVRNRRGRLGSTQALAPSNVAQLAGDTLSISADVCRMPKRLPAPWQFALLRLGCISVLRVPSWRETIKRLLVRWLISGRQVWPVRNSRRIRLGPDLEISDDTRLGDGYSVVEQPGAFVAIHMASQGYWQRQDEASPR
ncbi:MAG TPA: hypothetical protein VML58_00595 [Burkholderiaceae bacterium]|nr:hypothetical protein [Burkholderiaceae bacterium]